MNLFTDSFHLYGGKIGAEIRSEFSGHISKVVVEVH
jgi:hypothetical protein